MALALSKLKTRAYSLFSGMGSILLGIPWLMVALISCLVDIVNPFYFICFFFKGCLDLAFHSLSRGRGYVLYKLQLNSALFKLLLGLAC